jgi:hypothetical protein
VEHQQALRILNALANGVHPATGEVFVSDSPYQHPDTVRALFEAVKCMQSLKPPVQQSQGKQTDSVPGNTFVRWTSNEEQRLVAGFDSGKTTAELAKLHNRSRAAVEARLLKLGKIDVSALTVQLRYSGKPGT